MTLLKHIIMYESFSDSCAEYWSEMKLNITFRRISKNLLFLNVCAKLDVELVFICILLHVFVWQYIHHTTMNLALHEYNICIEHIQATSYNKHDECVNRNSASQHQRDNSLSSAIIPHEYNIIQSLEL